MQLVDSSMVGSFLLTLGARLAAAALATARRLKLAASKQLIIRNADYALTLPPFRPPAPSPLRVRHGGSEIVLYRDNLQQRMRGLAILPPPPGDEAPLFEHVCATVLQQSHLCPVPLEYQARRGDAAHGVDDVSTLP